MPAVLVHGVPETPAVWDPLRSRLHRDDVVALQLPGFGCARPDGFGATKEEYVAWLVGELSGLQAEGPIDLVGHDWGGGFVVRLVSTRPDLVRSWVSDAAGLGDPDFEWHEFAKIWQTPGAGEEFFDQQLAQTVEERAGVFELFGVPHDRAVAMAGRGRPHDGRLHPGPLPVGGRRGQGMVPRLPRRPGAGTGPGAVRGRRSSQTTEPGSAPGKRGRQSAELDGLGHWWMLQDPEKGAAVLEEFWASSG